MDRETELAYFTRLYEEGSPRDTAREEEKWNRRAESWERDYRQRGREARDSRICATVDYLQDRGLLAPERDVADLGCGPGRFAAAFARRVRSVTGFDLSEQMVAYGRRYVRERGLDNVTLLRRDFQTLDVEAEGLAGRFDLVFASLSPAAGTRAGLEKMMAMSRGHCCVITHFSGGNQLEERILAEVFHRDCPSPWTPRKCRALVNLLLLLGYCPELTYYRRRQERGVAPEADYAAGVLERYLPETERGPEAEERICAWLRRQAGADGLVPAVSDTTYARVLWDVREREAVL